MASREGTKHSTCRLRESLPLLGSRRGGMGNSVDTPTGIIPLVQEPYAVGMNAEVSVSLELIAAGVAEEAQADRGQSLHTSSHG